MTLYATPAPAQLCKYSILLASDEPWRRRTDFQRFQVIQNVQLREVQRRVPIDLVRVLQHNAVQPPTAALAASAVHNTRAISCLHHKHKAHRASAEALTSRRSQRPRSACAARCRNLRRREGGRHHLGHQSTLQRARQVNAMERRQRVWGATRGVLPVGNGPSPTRVVYAFATPMTQSSLLGALVRQAT